MFVYSNVYGLGDVIASGSAEVESLGLGWAYEYALVRWDESGEETYVCLTEVEVYTSWYDYACRA